MEWENYLEVIKLVKKLAIKLQDYMLAEKLREMEKGIEKKMINEWIENILKNAAQ